MTQEDIKLILTDLCGRIPYHPKGLVVNACTGAECEEWLTCATFIMFTSVTNNCRLYLRPMSAMTEKEKEELKEIGSEYLAKWENAQDPIDKWRLDAEVSYKRSEFYNSHLLDWRGLIPKGLALEAPDGMYNLNK